MTTTHRRPGVANRADLLRLDLQLCFALYSANNLLSRVYRPLLEPLGLTYPQYAAMMALWESSPMTVGDLGRRLKLDSGTLSPLLRRLETAGLVTRTRDAQDQRRVVIALTPDGQRLRDRAAEVPYRLSCDPPVTAEEAEALRAALTRLSGELSARLNAAPRETD